MKLLHKKCPSLFFQNVTDRMCHHEILRHFACSMHPLIDVSACSSHEQTSYGNFELKEQPARWGEKKSGKREKSKKRRNKECPSETLLGEGVSIGQTVSFSFIKTTHNVLCNAWALPNAAHQLKTRNRTKTTAKYMMGNNQIILRCCPGWAALLVVLIVSFTDSSMCWVAFAWSKSLTSIIQRGISKIFDHCVKYMWFFFCEIREKTIEMCKNSEK